MKIQGTYVAGHARPWTMIKGFSSRFDSQINIFLVTFCNSRYYLFCSWIDRLESPSYWYVTRGKRKQEPKDMHSSQSNRSSSTRANEIAHLYHQLGKMQVKTRVGSRQVLCNNVPEIEIPQVKTSVYGVVVFKRTSDSPHTTCPLTCHHFPFRVWW